ncbi:MAG: hypothetical protein ACYTCV_11650, partial [Planctomycetota bacterium]
VSWLPGIDPQKTVFEKGTVFPESGILLIFIHLNKALFSGSKKPYLSVPQFFFRRNTLDFIVLTTYPDDITGSTAKRGL